MSTVKGLRDRIYSLLWSKAAQQIHFVMDNVLVSGKCLALVAVAMIWKEKNYGGGVGIRLGNVPAGAGAVYHYTDDVLDVPDANYGRLPEERMTILLECFHAWRDMMGPKVPAARGGVPLRTTAVMDEAYSYVAGALFHIYDTTPAGQAPTKPLWAARDPLYDEAHRIAVSISNESVGQVSAADAKAMRDAVVNNSVYIHLRQNSGPIYGNDGVSSPVRAEGANRRWSSGCPSRLPEALSRSEVVLEWMR